MKGGNDGRNEEETRGWHEGTKKRRNGRREEKTNEGGKRKKEETKEGFVALEPFWEIKKCAKVFISP